MPRLMELADEFHLTTVEALEICDRLGIEVDDLLSEVDDADARAFRDGARRGILTADDEPAAPEPPSLAKQLGVPAATPPPPPVPAAPPPAPAFGGGSTGAAPAGSVGLPVTPAFGSAAPPAAPAPPAPPAAPRPSLRDRLPQPVADNLVIVAVCAVVVVGLIGYMVVSIAGGSEPPEDPEALGVEPAAALTIDDCIVLPDGAVLAELPELDTVDSPPCAEPHDVELYAEVRTYQGMIMERLEEYPGTEEVLADSLSECIARYEKFVGTPYRDSEYDVVALAPTGELWLDRSQRVSLCGVTSTDGSPLEGSVRGDAG